MVEQTFKPELKIIRNKSKTCHFGWPPGMQDPPGPDRTPLHRRIMDSTIVTGHEVYIGPGDEFIDDKNLYRSIMANPSSWCVWSTDPDEARALGVAHASILKDLDPAGKPIVTLMTSNDELEPQPVVGFFGANIILEDVTAQRKDAMAQVGGRLPALKNYKKLEENLAQARAEAAAKDHELAALKKKLEEADKAEAARLEKDRKAEEEAAKKLAAPQPSRGR